MVFVSNTPSVNYKQFTNSFLYSIFQSGLMTLYKSEIVASTCEANMDYSFTIEKSSKDWMIIKQRISQGQKAIKRLNGLWYYQETG